MKRDDYARGMFLTSDGPPVPPPFSRRDAITKGAFLTSDAGGPAQPTDIASRMDNLRKRIEEAAAIIRSAT